jgi:two-component system sensor histidine kinase DesK
LVYVGIPAYFVLAALSVWDIAHSHSAPVTALACGAIALYSVALLWLTFSSPGPGSERRTLELIGLLVVLAFGLAPLGGPAIMYLIAAGAMAADALRPPLGVSVLGLIVAVIAAVETWEGFGARDIMKDIVLALIVGLFAYGARRLFAANRELVETREELARLAVVSERLRFARDLHDLLGHSLSVIRAKSELATRLVPVDAARAGREMAEVEGVARQALAEVREAVTGYRRTSLAGEIANARTALQAADIEVDLVEESVEVPPDLDETLGWVLREAVTNVVRHSDATRCRIRTARDNGEVRLEVADNGHGPPLAGGTTASNGSGLAGIRERLAAVSGTLDLQPAPGGGLRLVACVPRTT